MVRIEVKSRSKNIKGANTDELTLEDTVSDLVKLIASENNHLNPNRFRVSTLDGSKRHTSLDLSKSFIECGFSKSAQLITVYVKDLGPQISWRTVFLVEYFGPLLIHPFFYFLPAIYASSSGIHTQTQHFALILVLIHFAKREWEAIFVHTFSQSTMPLFNIFKNSGHYWILSGVLLGAFSYAPSDFNPENALWKNWLFHVNDLPAWANYTLALLWAFAELSNLKTHLILALLRPKDDLAPKKHVIPYGYGFNLVSYPNYFFELLSWFFFALLTNNWLAWVFLIVSVGQMYLWAVKKHNKYLKTFGDEYKKLNRKAIFPFIA